MKKVQGIGENLIMENNTKLKSKHDFIVLAFYLNILNHLV